VDVERDELVRLPPKDERAIAGVLGTRVVTLLIFTL